ncbi:hypothetical protein BCY86_06670 [Pajaroellobacter abortibovis]|uniref:Transglycosylase SLT domain-containing protein n=2 Tax=Pajaroellobacter abortibovis TaxID=1882918 RepID=A0A1L6MY26_9BACT|nr:hypothetical protein BCY86_06670 [Pajaroellobacter abortibovis]
MACHPGSKRTLQKVEASLLVSPSPSSIPPEFHLHLPPVTTSPYPLPSLDWSLDHPGLAEVKEHWEKREFEQAALALERIQEGDPSQERPVRCAEKYWLGRLYALAGYPLKSALAFSQIAMMSRVDPSSASCSSLRDYALVRVCQAYAQAGAIKEARAAFVDVKAIADVPLGLLQKAKIAMAESLQKRGDFSSALPLWHDVLAHSSSGQQKSKAHAFLAQGILQANSSPSLAALREVFDDASKVLIEAPSLAESSGMMSVRMKAWTLLKKKGIKLSAGWTWEERVQRARAWLDSGDYKRALKEGESILKENRTGKKSSPLLCRAALVVARAKPMKDPVTADAWGRAIALCAPYPEKIDALFGGAKASRRSGRLEEASVRYEALERLAPTHSYADDARFYRGLVALEKADTASFLSLMLSLPEAYPRGDMRGEALFRAALFHLAAKEWNEALPILQRLKEIENPNQPRVSWKDWIQIGRADYYMARVAEQLGNLEKAWTGYEQVISQYPFSYVMMQAYARLSAHSPERAQHTLERIFQKEGVGIFPTKSHPEFDLPSYQRAMRLLEVGELELAQDEWSRAGVLSATVDPEVFLSTIRLYMQAYAPEVGYELLKTLPSFANLQHYPVGWWRIHGEVAYPRAFQKWVEREARNQKIPPAWIWAIMREESSFNPKAKSPADAFGLMQFIMPTAQKIAKEIQLPVKIEEATLFRPEVSIALGARYLANLKVAFTPHLALMIGSYNAGENAVGQWLRRDFPLDTDLWIEHIPYEETRNYVKRVLASMGAYLFLYEPESLAGLWNCPLRFDPSSLQGKGGGRS